MGGDKHMEPKMSEKEPCLPYICIDFECENLVWLKQKQAKKMLKEYNGIICEICQCVLEELSEPIK